MALPIQITTQDAPDEPVQTKSKVWILHCPRPGCAHAVMGPTDWSVVHRIGEHIVQAHTRPYWTRES